MTNQKRTELKRAAAGLAVLRVSFLTGEGSFPEALNLKALALAAVLLFLTRRCPKVKDWHPIVFIGLSALVGVLFSFGT